MATTVSDPTVILSIARTPMGSMQGALADASATDLIVLLPWVREDLCVEINRLTGVTNRTNPTRPPKMDGSVYKASLDKFIGLYEANTEINNSDNAFSRHQSGCFEGDSSDPNGGYHFYYALLPR